MPIFYQQDIDEDTKLGIWKIEEEESFFLQSVVPQRNVSHPHKKLQHLAGRYLLKYLFPDFPLSLILIADTRKPYLENETYHFSISHCGDYAAAIVSRTKRVGVDIELPSDKVERIKHKFLNEAEMSIASNPERSRRINDLSEVEDLTLLWSCKEAVFKWYGLGEVDFKGHIVTRSITSNNDSFETIISFEKESSIYLTLYSRMFNQQHTTNNQPTSLVLSYVTT
jgi:phosphopantetheinyl transferase